MILITSLIVVPLIVLATLVYREPARRKRQEIRNVTWCGERID
jgi:hypothetical protein